MGYTTYFSGSVTVEPPLNEHEASFLKEFCGSRRMHRTNGPLYVQGSGPFGQGHDDDVLDFNNPDPDQPGLWCHWEPYSDGTEIEWDGSEKFYYAAEWMEYIVTNLLAPSARAYIDAHLKEDERLKHFTCDHVVNGEIHADGEDSSDHWLLEVANNVVTVHEGQVVYGPLPNEAPPTPEEIAGAIKSIGGGPAKVKVWTTTVDIDEVITQVFGTAQAAYDSLKLNYWEGEPDEIDVTTAEGRGRLIEELTERLGYVLYIEEHEVEVTL